MNMSESIFTCFLVVNTNDAIIGAVYLFTNKQIQEQIPVARTQKHTLLKWNTRATFQCLCRA